MSYSSLPTGLAEIKGVHFNFFFPFLLHVNFICLSTERKRRTNWNLTNTIGIASKEKKT